MPSKIWKRRRRSVGGLDLSLYLPRVGPFENDDLTLVSSLSSITYSVSQAVASSRASPLKYDTITIDAGVVLTPSGPYYSHHIHCDTLIVNGTLSASGVAGDSDRNGKDGGSGGSGGAGEDEESYNPGDGGSNSDGEPGEPYPVDGIYSPAGLGGQGGVDNSGFTYPNGGNGTVAIISEGDPTPTTAASAGAGGNFFGGGATGTGTGAGANTTGGPSGAGGINIVCRVIQFGASGKLLAVGGDAYTGGATRTGAGGGGSIRVSAQKKQTSPNEVSVAGGYYYDLAPPQVYADSGNTLLMEIEADHVSETTHTTNWTDTWDNT